MMRVECTVKEGVARVDVTSMRARETGSGAPLDALVRALVSPSLSAAVVNFTADITNHDDAVTTLSNTLEGAPVPLALVSTEPLPEALRPVAAVCHFSFTSVDAADHYLRGLVQGRPPHVVHAVMTSIRNSRHLPLEAALAAETRLFTTLSARKQRASKRPGS